MALQEDCDAGIAPSAATEVSPRTASLLVLTEQHGQRFEAVIHNNLVGLLQKGRTLTIWYSRTDRYHDRYVEILCVNAVDDAK